MRMRHSLATTVTALALAATVAACSGTTSKVGARQRRPGALRSVAAR